MNQAISLNDVLRAWEDIETGLVYRDKAIDKNADRLIRAIRLTVGYLKQTKEVNNE